MVSSFLAVGDHPIEDDVGFLDVLMDLSMKARILSHKALKAFNEWEETIVEKEL